MFALQVTGRSRELMGDPDHPPGWMTYITVDPVDKACKQAGKAKGKVLKEPFDIQGVGRTAMISDPSGAAVGLITPAMRA